MFIHHKFQISTIEANIALVCLHFKERKKKSIIVRQQESAQVSNLQATFSAYSVIFLTAELGYDKVQRGVCRRSLPNKELPCSLARSPVRPLWCSPVQPQHFHKSISCTVSPSAWPPAQPCPLSTGGAQRQNPPLSVHQASFLPSHSPQSTLHSTELEAIPLGQTATTDTPTQKASESCTLSPGGGQPPLLAS